MCACAFVSLRESGLQEKSTLPSLPGANLCKPASPHLLLPLQKKELHLQLRNKSDIKGSFYLLFKLLKKEIFQLVSTAASF